MIQNKAIKALNVAFRLVTERVKLKLTPFFNEGSCLSLMEKSLADELDLKGEKGNLSLARFNGGKKMENYAKVSCSIQGSGLDSRQMPLTNIRATKNLNLFEQTMDFENLRQRFQKLNDLPLEDYEVAKPRLLISLPHAHLTYSKKTVFLADDGPIANETALGWCIFGKLNGDAIQRCKSLLVHEAELDSFKTKEFDIFGIHLFCYQGV